MSKIIIGALMFCLLGGVVELAFSSAQQPADAKAKVEYKAFVRADIEDMASAQVKKDGEKNGHLEGSNTEGLTAGLNVLAKQGWDLVAIEPYSEQQDKTPQGTVTYRHYPTYVFKRLK